MSYALLYNPNPALCIQCPTKDGNPITLQQYDATNPFQQWSIIFQTNSDGYLGFAFVNPKTNLSVTYNGQFQPLVVQPFSYGSTDQDAWSILNLGSGQVRIAYPPDTSFSWNDLGGNGQAGDQIGLWNDTGANSVFQVQATAAAQPVAARAS